MNIEQEKTEKFLGGVNCRKLLKDITDIVIEHQSEKFEF
jgi:hypothetical protein